VFSPVYDVMNTALHVPETQSALGLIDDNRDQKTDFTKESFDTLASRLGLRDRIRDSTYRLLLSSIDGYEVSLFRDAPGLDSEIRNTYIDLVDERIRILNRI